MLLPSCACSLCAALCWQEAWGCPGQWGGRDCQGHHGPFRDEASSSHLHILTKGFSNKHCKTKLYKRHVLCCFPQRKIQKDITSSLNYMVMSVQEAYLKRLSRFLYCRTNEPSVSTGAGDIGESLPTSFCCAVLLLFQWVTLRSTK